MLSLFKRIVLSGALLCMTQSFGLAGSEIKCVKRGSITIEKEHCLKASRLFPLPKGPDNIIFNGHEIPSRVQTCELWLRIVDESVSINIPKKVVEKAFDDGWNKCHGYGNVTIHDAQGIRLDIGAYKDQPGHL
uniref:Hesp-417-like protein n=1 Tax=Melampsora medusae f. sp. tremuloides TaxID=374510 RepID=A7KKH6_9BASI|nr:hesp-417-like protein [Melampsora medusae f. sp. tremuloides]